MPQGGETAPPGTLGRQCLVQRNKPDGESRTTVSPSRGARARGVPRWKLSGSRRAGRARRRASGSAVETFARHEASLRRTAQRYSICDDDADEALQRGLEILLLQGALRQPARTGPLDPDGGQARGARGPRRARADPRRPRRAARPPDPGGLDRDAPEPKLDGPAERAERDEAVERSREALTTLKPQELRALSLLAEGYSYREIAEITGYSATKVNRCVSEGRERFRRFLVRRDGGARCTELAPLLSAFADDEAGAADVATLREHLRTCAHCRSTLRAYRAAPRAAAALLPVLPPTRGALARPPPRRLRRGGDPGRRWLGRLRLDPRRARLGRRHARAPG